MMVGYRVTVVALALCRTVSVRPLTVKRQYGTSFSSLSLSFADAADLDLSMMPTPSTKLTASVGIPAKLSREEGRRVLNTVLLPESKYGERIEIGRDAQGLERSTVVAATDPRLTLTYGEFPLESQDDLIDLALPHVSLASSADSELKMLDLGSGCGRLAMYMALTRETTSSSDLNKVTWQVHGIEISRVLHDVAVECLETGIQEGFFVDASSSSSSSLSSSSLQLHAGAAADWTEVLADVDLIFAYSTVFPARGFSEEWSTMIMGSEWSSLLANSCRDGCVIVTTDRTLDPNDGWELLDRLDVANREVMGSTGYIQRLRAK